MRKSLLFCGIMFSSVFTYAQLNTVKKTDNNGYVYEIVENDPSNTRIYTLKNGLKIYLAQLKIMRSLRLNALSNYCFVYKYISCIFAEHNLN